MKALVTGSAGFLGSHFATALRTQGWEVVGLDVRHPEVDQHVIDCRSYFREMATVYDLVVHCAAVIPDRAARDRFPMLVAENLDIDRQMFEWAIATKQRHVLYFSSSAAYPVDLQTRNYALSEGDLYPPTARAADGLYGWTKVLGELHAETARAAGVPVTVVRPFTGYGTDQSDEYPFPAILDRAIAHQDPLMVWGTGAQVRDFVHVNDIVAIALTACEKDVQHPINIGTGIPTSMVQLAQKIAGIVGYEPDIACLVTKPDGVAYRVNGSDYARRLMTSVPTFHMEHPPVDVTTTAAGFVSTWRYMTLDEGIKLAL